MSKKSLLKSAYSKARSRVRNLINRYKKKGYDVEIQIPAIPKRITEASIRRLEKITPKAVRKKTYAPDLQTGERITYQQYKNRYGKAGTPAEEFERVKVGTPFQWQLAIDYVESVIEDYPDKTAELFRLRMDSAKTIYGEQALGEALQEMVDSGDIVAPSEGYNYQAVLEMSNTLMQKLMFTPEEQAQIREQELEELDSNQWYDGEFDDIEWD